MAEGITKDLILDEFNSHGEVLPIKVMSAGTIANDGSPASDFAVKVSAHHGIDISSHRSRHLSEKIIRDADLILTMEKYHTNIVKQICPMIDNVYELKSYEHETEQVFVKNLKINDVENIEIMDPIGMSLNVYMDVFNELREEIARVSRKIFALVKEKYEKQKKV